MYRIHCTGMDNYTTEQLSREAAQFLTLNTLIEHGKSYAIINQKKNRIGSTPNQCTCMYLSVPACL